MQMTNTTNAATDTWSVLFEDSTYNKLVDELDTLLKDTATQVKAGYRLDVVNEKQKPKIDVLTDKFKNFASEKLESIEQRLGTIKEELSKENVTDPQSELIKRQNLEAKLSLFDNYDVIDLIKQADVKDISIYELNLYQNTINERFSEVEKDNVSYKMSELKQAILHPEENNEEYQNLAKEYSVLNSLGMAQNGVPVTINKNDNVEIKPITDNYREMLQAN
ncbi:hypothetical protein KG099_06560 [Staphylococcus lugdunensis]|uniref:hypothetical protein n=1 Tax=Staphylococcus lugdunensis TaxID=28035 RepID=UPI0020965607|nr:hypothetical protein [Staphylococcus lugdunensis]MCO6562772.1 hypothetical protein [Staphylococcus lugdunensis]MCO6566901.1 hypothetical protein [Staphylococcus lugdunensis]MCO6569374.1 hypothetical protein [Staphylococcus lugdunensis]MCO6591799.1 hypothetical protein [Staphylococcus lugdunensis]MCO6594216.1 hypothetical protein [Staphylococcus lugdunensis]